MSAEACDSVSSAWELMHNDSCSVHMLIYFFSPIITDDFFLFFQIIRRCSRVIFYQQVWKVLFTRSFSFWTAHHFIQSFLRPIVFNELILTHSDVIGTDLIWKLSCNEIEQKKNNNPFNNVVCYYKCGVLVYIESKFFKVVSS